MSQIKATTNAIFAFNAAVWVERTTFFAKTDGSHEDSTAISRVALAAMNFWELANRSGSSSKFGNAGNRSRQQEQAANDYAQELLNNIPDQDYICFTDGASKGNPGLAGAGAVICKSKSERPLTHGAGPGHR